MEDYFKAKKILFDMLSEKSTAVSNLDDDYGFRIITGSKGKKYFYGIDKNCDYKASDIKIDINGLEFVIIDRQNIYKIKSSLTGRFNVYNILAAYSMCVNLNLDVNMIIKGIEEFKPVKGRFDKILLPNGAYAVIDYSHTSDSLKNAIEAAIDIRNNQNKKGKIITIFGCGGNKDKMKRPVMGKYSTTLSDVTIITSDNPRYEEPKDIIADILKGVKSDSEFEVIENREDAIKKGISISGNSDIILICGKGHETYQEVKGVRTDFDDYEIVKKYSQLVK
jgi:UDP-N-acetylmuramoyl-L-alanyl-D-glutamate--2,6-diaminopimelate ligase